MTTLSLTEKFVLGQLEAGDIDMLTDFADFAAGDADGEDVAQLMLAFLLSDASRWAFMMAGIRALNAPLADAIDKLENEMERSRARFVEWKAAQLIRQAEDLADREGI